MMVITMKYIFLIISLLMLISCVHGLQNASIGSSSISFSTGDDAVITGTISDESRNGHIWLYTGDYSNLVYGQEPINITNINASHYEFNVILNKSLNLKSGKYKLFIQFDGKNDVQEVLYDMKNTKIYSPWIYVKPIDVSSNIAEIPTRAEKYCNANKNYCDDTFYNTTIVIEGPFIRLSDQYQVQNDQLDITKNSLLYVGGVTNIDPTNTINVTLDYTQLVTARIDERNTLGYYKWYAYLNISRLRSGDHTILIESSKTDPIKNILTISEYIPTPVPTQVPIKYVRGEVNNFVSVTNVPPTVKPTSTPIIADENNKEFIPIITDTPIQAPSGAIYITPTATNNISIVTPSPTAKSSVKIIIPIISIILLILISKRRISKV
jgi:hypothetical protein